MEINIVGDRWGWKFEYEGHWYGDTGHYQGSSMEKLKEIAEEKRKQTIEKIEKNKIINANYKSKYKTL